MTSPANVELTSSPVLFPRREPLAALTAHTQLRQLRAMSDILASRKKQMDEAARLAAIHAKVPVTDTSALDAQVADKRAAQAAAASRELQTAEELNATAQLASALEGKRQEDLAAQRRAVGAFQEQQAAAYAPPSFDYSLEGGQEGVASLRSFAGEDQSAQQRKAQQAQQLAGWCDDALSAKEAKATLEAAEAQKEHDQLMALVGLGQKLTQQQEGRRAQLAAAVAAANQALAAAKRERDEHAAAERAAGVMNALILDDGPAAGAHRTDFRGFTPEQVRDVARAQEAQRAEAAAAEGRQRAEARGDAVNAALVNKAAEKVTMGQLAFQQQQRAAVAAVVERQNAERQKLEAQQAADAKQPNMSDTFQDRFGHHAR